MTLLRIIAVGLFTYSTLAFATPWTFVKSEDGITIHKRDHGNGLVEVRAQMQVETSYSGFLLLLEDSDNVPNWIDNVSHSEVLMQISSLTKTLSIRNSKPLGQPVIETWLPTPNTKWKRVNLP